MLRRIMPSVFIVIIIVLLSACGGPKQELPSDRETIVSGGTAGTKKTRQQLVLAAIPLTKRMNRAGRHALRRYSHDIGR